MTKFKLGDQVKVINYGNLINQGYPDQWDMCPEVVGQTGIISQAEVVQGESHYAIDNIIGKHAWYNDDQLELIYRPEYKTI